VRLRRGARASRENARLKRQAHGTFAAVSDLFWHRKRQAGPLHEQKSFGANGRQPCRDCAAVAIFGVLAMLIVDHGPWSHPRVQTAEVANYKTTGAAARAAGATVTPTSPKPELEPDAPGPKPAQPANPMTQ
jgi:hypothetical protein